MNKKEKSNIERSSQVKSEKNFNFMKLGIWTLGILMALMAISYISAYLTGKPEKHSKESVQKAYIKSDSLFNAASAIDTTKVRLKPKK